MKHILLSLLVLALSVSGLYGQTIEPTVPADEEDPYVLLCGQADKAVADGDFEGAAQRLLEAMSLHPDSPQNVLLLSNLGMIYSYMDNDSMAIVVLDEAVRKAPKLRTAQENRAKVLLKIGRDKDAYEAFGNVIAADSLNMEARYYHGTIALYSGNLDVAEADFGVLASLAPDELSTAQALGTLYSLSGRDRESLPYMRRLVSEDPAPEYYAALAGALLSLGELSEASAILADGMGRYADDPELYYYRAILNRERFLLDDAHRDAAMALRLGANPKRIAAIFEKK